MSLAQLSPGDISIIGIRADNPDEFTFVALVDIPAGTEIYFTDNAWCNGMLRGGEGTTLYTSPGLLSGDVVKLFDLSGLSISGDQVIAYQGTSSSPTFIAAAQTNSTQWQNSSNCDDSNRSELPPGLTDGSTAVAVGAGPGVEDEYDNSEYTGPRDFGNRSKSEMLALLNDPNNWTPDNDPFVLNDAPFTGSLPVQLIDFDLQSSRDGIILLWSTASELNNDFFVIEHSLDGIVFEQIGQIQGAGNSSTVQEYRFWHQPSVPGKQYYRLTQIDYDGTSTVFPVRGIQWKGYEIADFAILPTVVLQELKVFAEANTEMDLSVFDLSGRVVVSEKISPRQGEIVLRLDHLVPGVYFVQIGQGSFRQVLRFVKN